MSVNIRFSPNALKYGPEITPYFDTFHAVPVGVEVFHKSRSSRTIKFNSLQFLDNNTLQLSLTSCH